MIDSDVRTWCETIGIRVLRRIGLSEGETMADFGCREGRYAVPAARLVGRAGCVYAIDRDRGALEELKQRARAYGLVNIRALCADFVSHALLLEPASCDLVLLFDVLHGVYFPESAGRVALLRRVREILRPGGRLAVYPTHAAKYGPSQKQLEMDIHQAGFREIGRSRRRLLHDDRLVRGWVLMYQPDKVHQSLDRLRRRDS
jgi:ubiquinone/menaquinone biosynthesis C-methylase UbiE